LPLCVRPPWHPGRGDIATPFASTASLSPNGIGAGSHPSSRCAMASKPQARSGQYRQTSMSLGWSQATEGKRCASTAVAALAALVLRLRVRSLTQGRGWHRIMRGSGSFPRGLHPATGVEQVDYRCVSLVGRSVSTTACKMPWVTPPTTTCGVVNAGLAWAATLRIRRRREPGVPKPSGMDAPHQSFSGPCRL